MGNAKNEYKGKSRNNSSAGTSSKPKELGFHDYRFVSIELDKERKQQYRLLVESGEFSEFGEMGGYIDAGFSVKFSKDKKGGGVVVSVSCTDSENINGGLILSGRATTATAAWNVFRFKSEYICQNGNWSAYIDRDVDRDDIG